MVRPRIFSYEYPGYSAGDSCPEFLNSSIPELSVFPPVNFNPSEYDVIHLLRSYCTLGCQF